MKISKILIKKMIEGYKKLSKLSNPPIPESRTNLPLKILPPVLKDSNEIDIPIKITPEIAKGAVLPAKLESPMEVKGELALKPPKIERKIEGFELSIRPPKRIKLKTVKREEEKLTLSYPLIPEKPKKGERVFAYVKIFWDKKKHRYVYQVIEPLITPKIADVLKKVKDLLEQRLDVDFSKLNILEASKYLKKQINELLSYFKFKLTEEEIEILNYYINRDFLGFGRIEPLMHDPNIEDISCDGVGIPIFVFHRDSRLGSVMTNIVFDRADELDSFIVRLAQLCGKSISIAEPLVDGALPDGSRLQATLATDIARRGSNFTIRKFSAEPLTPISLLNYGTVDLKTLAYLWLAVDYGRSILVSGGTASGKTTFLNVLSLFIRPDKKIVSIEDTAELRLPHPHWIPAVARTPISTGKIGEVDLFQLLKESLRQRPDYIIVGEVRGAEAYVLFQQMATGHPSLATIHAENMDKLLDRLTTPPISLPAGLIGSLDIVVFMVKMRYKNRFVRRISEIVEMVEFPKEARKPITNTVFKWNPLRDAFESAKKSVILKRIADVSGLSRQELLDELERRMAILMWMQRKNITNYRDVYSVVTMYYSYPNRVLSIISGEI